jgi:PAS domain S-box-containing protein
MKNQNNRKEALRRRIGQVLKSRETGLTDLSSKTIEEVLQEISIYHQELEFQNLELMRIQDELERSEKHFEELFSNAPIGYVIVDANSIIHSANALFAEMIGQKPEKLKSQNLNLFVHPEYQDSFYLLIKKVIKEKSKSSQLILVLGAKMEYFVKMECNLLNANNKDLLRIGLLDVTHEVKNELKLKQKNEEYVALNKQLLQANKELRQTSDKLFQSELNLKTQFDESTAQNEELLHINQELQRLTADLSESNDRNSALVGANPDLMFVFDREGVFVDYHSPNPEILLLKPEEFLNRNADEVLPGYLADITRQAIAKLFETGEPQGYSYSIETKRGENHFDARMVKYGNNNALTIIRDVTDQKNAEEKLRQSKETYLGIINSVSESIYVQDENGVFLEVNDAAIASYGLKREDMIGKTPKILSAEGKNDTSLVAEMVKKAFNGEPQRFDFWGRNTDGTVFPNEVTLTKGVYFGKSVVIALARDISERKKAEEALRESEERFRGLYENATVGIYRTTPDGEIVLANTAMVKMLGYKSFDDLRKRNLSTDGYGPDYSRDDFKKEISKSGMIHKFESTLKVEGGSIIHISESARMVCDKEGKPVYYEGIVEDITERKKADEAIRQSEMILKRKNEEYMTLNSKLIESNKMIVQINKELITAREKAEESDKLKTAFLANMSHEIRTPMNAIIGFSEILLKPDLSNEKQDEFTRIINMSCHQLLSVVNDMIDIARIETGQLDIHIGKANINQVITRVRDTYITQAAQQNVTIKVSFQLIEEYAEIETDSVKLNQILTNLLSNAIKFTEEGEIEIGYTIIDGFIQFYIKDTGIGIKPEHKEIIFERFRQVEMDDTRHYGGTGLGLPICKAFVEMLGGRIWVESEFGNGSAFYFTLPYGNIKPSMQEVKIDEKIDDDLSGIVVLVAEDEEANFIYLNELLSETGATIIRARDGIEAINFFRENKNIGIVLMDIKMPGLDGIQATKAIKAINSKVPVIAITAYALTGDREKCLAAGCDEYISKPVRRSALLGLIQALLKN